VFAAWRSPRGGAGGHAAREVAPLEGRAAYVPDDTDRAATTSCRGARPIRQARAQLRPSDHRATARRRASRRRPAAYATISSTRPSTAIVYRRAASELLEEDDIDPALRKQLEMEVADDPLVLADKRLGEGRRTRIARDVNAFSEAVGRSILSFVFLPVRLSQALVNVAVAEHTDDPISVQQRQALAHWKQYVESHPETPEARELIARIESLQKRWFDTKRRRSVRAAEQALEHDQSALALLLADRALRYAPGDREAGRLRAAAAAGVAAHQAAARAEPRGGTGAAARRERSARARADHRDVHRWRRRAGREPGVDRGRARIPARRRRALRRGQLAR
jgi:hypothetical protein